MGNTGVIGDGGAIGNCLAARRLDFRYHLLCRFRAAAGAIHRAAQIIDHHLGTATRQFQGMGAAKSAAGAGNDGDFAVKANGHDKTPLR